MSREVERLRKKQAARVMPMVGNMIDHWEQLPNDLRDQIAEESPAFAEAVQGIWDALEWGE